MELEVFLSHRGYQFIAGLVLLGILMIGASLMVNAQVAKAIQTDLRHQEKLLEYYRSTCSQLGTILVGIGVSLAVFYFQQSYQETRRRKVEVQQVIAKMSLQLARGSAQMASISKVDDFLDAEDLRQTAPLKNKGAMRRLDATSLTSAIARIRDVQDDVDLSDLALVNISQIFESSFLVSELDPALLFNTARDEADIRYALAQLAADYRDLDRAIGSVPAELAVTDPSKAAVVKDNILDIDFELDLLRMSGRRLLARTCWLLSAGESLVEREQSSDIEADGISEDEWMEKVRPVLSTVSVGFENCFEILDYNSPDDKPM